MSAPRDSQLPGPTNDGSVAAHAVRGATWTIAGKIAQAVVQICTIAILARLLSPTDFGIAAACVTVVGGLYILSKGGLGPALVRSGTLSQRTIESSFSYAVAAGFVALALLMAAAPLVASAFRIPSLTSFLRVAALAFPLAGAGVVADALLQRDLRFRRLATIDLISYVFGYACVGIGLALAGGGTWSLVLAMVSQVGVRSAFAYASAPHPLAIVPRFDQVTALMKFGGGVSLMRIGNFLALQGDTFVVSRTLGATALGIYTRAYSFFMVPVNLIGDVADRVLYSTLAGSRIAGVDTSVTYVRVSAASALLAAPVSGVLVVAAPEVVEVLLGPNWMAASPAFAALAVTLVPRAGYKVSDGIARAIGAVYMQAAHHWVYAGMVLLGAALGSKWDLVGAAVGVGAAIALHHVGLVLLVCRRLAIPIWRVLGPQARYAAYAVACALPAHKLLAGMREAGMPIVLRLALASIIMFLPLVVAALGVRLLDREGVAAIKEALSAWKKSR